MDLVLELLLLLPLGVITIQDFKTRTIIWWSIPIFLITSGIIHYQYFKEFNLLLISSNVLFFVVLLLCLWLYLSVRNKQVVNLNEKYLGIGDILFFIPICFLFSLMNLITYFILSLIICLVLGLLLSYISKSDKSKTNDFTIPLAGGLSITLFITRLINYFTNFNVFDDSIFIMMILESS